MQSGKPISPSALSDRFIFQVDQMVDKLNRSIMLNNWHTQHFPLKDEGGEWRAIILDIGVKDDVMKSVVGRFMAEGWDCKVQRAYDGRGPHNCFYINEKHFI